MPKYKYLFKKRLIFNMNFTKVLCKILSTIDHWLLSGKKNGAELGVVYFTAKDGSVPIWTTNFQPVKKRNKNKILTANNGGVTFKFA